MIVVHDIDEVGFGPFEDTYVHAVDAQFDFIVRGGQGTPGGCVGARQVFDWMIEGEFLYQFPRGNTLLHLRDENVVGSRSDVTALLIVQVIVVGIGFHVVVASVGSPMDPEFHVVILECHEGDGRLGSFAEEEAQGVKVGPGAHTGVGPVGTLGNILGERIYGDLLGEDGVLRVHHVSPYEEFDVVYDGVPSLYIECL